MVDHEVFELGDVTLQSGEVFADMRLAWKSYGRLNADKSNAILYPCSFGAQHGDMEWLVKDGNPLDPSRYFIVIPNLFGNGLSSSPSNVAATPYGAKHFPLVTISDNVHAQRRLLGEVLGIEKLALVYGFSMGGQQALHWGALYPEMVDRLCAICATAVTAVHTRVVFEGVKAALTGDAAWRDGWFEEHPERGLRAMGRVYAGWGFSQAFYRQALYRELGFADLEDFLVHHWEARFTKRNGNDLLAMIATVQAANLGQDPAFKGDLGAALGRIRARTLIMPSETDFYFPVEDARGEAALIPGARLCPIASVWGHRAGNPVSHARDAHFIFEQVRQLLAA
jgi:homoserine O-acetyltransferase